MLIFISATAQQLDSRVNPRFGRTPCFIQYDTNETSWQAIGNQAAAQSGGAGVAAAQILIDRGAEAAISGRFGPNAQQALSAAGIKMFTFDNDQKTVADVIQEFQAGQLVEVH